MRGPTTQESIRTPQEIYGIPAGPPMRIGYVFTELPGVAGMFPNAEMEAMATRGVAVEIFLLRNRPAAGDEARRLARIYPIHRSPYFLSLRLWADCARAALLHPFTTSGVVLRTFIQGLASPRVLLKSLGVIPKAIHFAAVARRSKVTLIHAYWAHLPAHAAEIMSRLSGLEYTTWAHAGGDIYQRTFQTRAALRGRIRNARVVLTCNRANLAYFEKLVEPEDMGKILLLTHGIELEQFYPSVRHAPRPVPVLLMVGGLAPAKGHRFLIDACAMLARQGYPFELRLAGEGRLAEELKRRAREAGIEDRVSFLGHVPHGSLPALYREADVFVVPSVIGPSGSRDGLPNVLLEAMATGLACVGSNVASIPEVIEHGRTGLLVPPGSPAALAAALERLIVDPALRKTLGSAAMDLVTSNYSRGPAMDMLHEVFRTLHEERIPD